MKLSNCLWYFVIWCWTVITLTQNLRKQNCFLVVNKSYCLVCTKVFFLSANALHARKRRLEDFLILEQCSHYLRVCRWIEIQTNSRHKSSIHFYLCRTDMSGVIEWDLPRHVRWALHQESIWVKPILYSPQYHMQLHCRF